LKRRAGALVAEWGCNLQARSGSQNQEADGLR
jgi:hypothetical protein